MAVKVHIIDPVDAYHPNDGRNGWHPLYGSSADALAGCTSRVFLTRIPANVKSTILTQPNGYTCGPTSMAIALGQSSCNEAWNWLAQHGLITSDYGTDYSGIVGYLASKGYYCDYDGCAHDREMDGSIFKKIENCLQMGYKVIVCVHGVNSGGKQNIYTNNGHYITLDGIQTDGKDKGTYMFSVNEFGLGAKGNHVMLIQEILKSRGIKGADGKALSIDGSCGNNTVHAIKWYQQYINEHGGKLRTDGYCDRATIANMIGL